MHQSTGPDRKGPLLPEQSDEPCPDFIRAPWWSGRFYTGAHRPAVHIDLTRRPAQHTPGQAGKIDNPHKTG